MSPWRNADKRLVALTLVVLVVGFAQAMRSSNDFAIYFHEAWEKLASGNFEIYEVSRPTQGGYYYSPFFALVGSWFAPLGLSALKVLYALATALGFVVGWNYIKRLVRESGAAVGFGVGALSLLFATNNILGQMLTGNVSLLVVLLAYLGLYFSTRHRPAAAGFFWALAANIKVYPIYLGLYFLWKRDWRALAYGAVFALTLLLVPGLFWGMDRNIEIHSQWIQMLRAFGPQSDFGRLALQSFAAMGYRSFMALGWSATLGLKLMQLFTLGLNVFVLLKLRRNSPGDNVWAIAWCVTFMALATPASWVHHLGVAYVPLFTLVLAHAIGLRDRLAYALLALGTLLYAGTTDAIIGRTLNDVFEAHSVPTWGLAILVLGAYRVQSLAHKKTPAEA
ncbi:MAG TPA: glycosyltransferase family 87 protein [Bdellovibrionota bacterium]|jgi:hypothetical protein|nr:glycosyltransferase family 87 protein [Bdellovibrionota bacterium]